MRFLVGFTVLLTSVIALLIYGATSPANLTGDDFKFPAPSIIRVFFNGASSPANLTDRTYSLHYDYYCESCPSVTAPSIIRVFFTLTGDDFNFPAPSIIRVFFNGASSPANLTGDDFKFPAPSTIRVFFNGASSPANLTDRAFSLHYDYYRDSCPSVTAPSIIRVLFSDCFIEGFADETLSTENNASPNLSLKGFDVIDAIKSEREYVSPGGLSCAELPVFLELPLFPAREAALVAGTRVYRLVTVRKFSAVAFKLPAPQATLSLLLASAASRVFSERETVILSGAHSLGIKHCTFFENSLYNFSGTGKPDTELADACLGVVSCSSLVLGAREAGLLGFADETLSTENNASPNLSLKGFDVIDAIKSEREYVSPGGLSCAELPRCPAREAALVSGPRVYSLVTVRKDSAVTVRKDNAVAFKLPAPLSSLSLLLATASSKGSSKLTILVFILWFTTKTVDGKFEQYPDVPSDHPNYVFFNQFLKELRAQNAQSPINIYTGAEKTNYLSIFWAVLAASGMLGVGYVWIKFQRWLSSDLRDMNAFSKHLDEKINEAALKLDEMGRYAEETRNIAADTNSQIRDLREEMRAGFARVADRGDQQLILDILYHVCSQIGVDVQPLAGRGGDIRPVAHGGRILTITQGIRSVLPAATRSRIFGRQH
ncbi:unnamed protein product [Arabidopsis arenosa]|uniref:peroxidase n=1 Tax=Arabidopsis arenosa TaxID=38785 RepID=A0A8S2AJ15_ARAAE|nr:unnamed protein product [Arabidopsis arenosa]